MTLEAVAQLKPAFRPDGTVTAGNACPLNDGAAAVVVMSDRRAAQLGLTPLARILSTAVSWVVARDHGAGPRGRLATGPRPGGSVRVGHRSRRDERGVRGAGHPVRRRLGVDETAQRARRRDRRGSSLRQTGARIATTLIHALQERDGQFGLETMCVGGGQGMAMVLERLS